jgi:hypothetical protein
MKNAQERHAHAPPHRYGLKKFGSIKSKICGIRIDPKCPSEGLRSSGLHQKHWKAHLILV